MSVAVSPDSLIYTENLTKPDVSIPTSRGWNRNLRRARDTKNDEFYTQLADIENELAHYAKSFVGKSVYCNCDDPSMSQFWRYFSDNFKVHGLSRLVSTHYVRGGRSYVAEIVDGEYRERPLSGNGDFRSAECIEILKGVDIVVTNPPFSLFRDFIKLLTEHDKEYLVVGNLNMITSKDIFPLFLSGRLRMGITSVKNFTMPSGATQKFGNIRWYSTLPCEHDKVVLTAYYAGNEQDYPGYDNCDAIDVSKVSRIPLDYAGVMGVPITLLEKLNPRQFELVGFLSNPVIGGRYLYKRLLVRNLPTDGS